MNQQTQDRVIEMPAESFSRASERAMPTVVQQGDVTPLHLLNLAVSQGADLAKLEKLMDLQERWEKNEARKAFHAAFAAFKSESVQVLRNKLVTDGPLKGKRYADLFAAVDAVTPFMSKHGLSAAWRVTKDERDWIEVTCTISHILGHSESVPMGGPPDTGGAKNGIQARASTVSYLERYTLLAATGLASRDQDDDGGGGEREKARSSYPAEDFDTNLPKWQGLITSGKKTADQIVANVAKGTKGALTDEQAAKVRAIKKDDPKAPVVTYAALAERLNKATDVDVLDADADLIGAIADPTQREELQGLYKARRAELRGE